MVQIRDDLTIDKHRKMMDGLDTENPVHQTLTESVHSILQRPENVFYRDMGCGRGMWVARNNTLICPRTPKPTVWYLGGCRWKKYQNEAEAEIDVKNLSRGMSYKWAILNMMFSKMALEGRAKIEEVSASRIGGGKSVIYEPNYSSEIFSGPGEPLSGIEKSVMKDKVAPVLLGLTQYIFAPDMGTCCAHVDYVEKYAPDNVACLSRENCGSGDPSPITARGVYESLLESVLYQRGTENLNRLTIAVQGVGKVGSFLIDYIIHDFPEVDLLIADIDGIKAREKVNTLMGAGISAKQVGPTEIYDQAFDVFSPNSMGQSINPSTIRRMVKGNPQKDLIIVGSANNQIDDRKRDRREETEGLLKEYGIVYAPDFVVNLGGILNLMYEFHPLKDAFGGACNHKRSLEVITGIRPVVREIHERSSKAGLSTQLIADRMAEEHIARWAFFYGLSSDDLIERRYLVDIFPGQ